MLRKIDNLLNGITMYRLMVYGLGLLAIVAFTLSVTGALGFAPLAMLTSLSILVAICYAANWFMRTMWRVPTNTESWLITALILFFVMPPVNTMPQALLLCATAVIAMASKYMLAFAGKHIFNPAAFAMAVVGLFGLLQPSWWVGSSLLWPFVLVLGLLVIRKIRRFHVVVPFIAAGVVTTVVVTLLDHGSVADVLWLGLTASPVLFLGSIMLTEPSTMPGRRDQRIIFGILVGVLYAAHPHVGDFFVYPEVALLIGNLYAFTVSPKYRLQLTLKEIVRISDNVYDFVFASNRRPDFIAGQYLEWTLPHKQVDDRGNRRTFTIASSPTEDTIHLGIKTYEPASSFKRALLAMQPGETLFAGQVNGSFTLPQKPQKLLFIAGGIGITPFRSMVKYLIDAKQQSDVVLLYAVANPKELAYKDIFEQAKTIGVTFLPVLTVKDPVPIEQWPGLQGMVSKEFLQEHVPDLAERLVYLSGPHAMVDALEHQVKQAGATRTIVDYFPGY